MSVRVVGMDPSFTSWGLALADLDVHQERLEVTGLEVIRPEVITGKQVRQNSKDIDRAHQLLEGVLPHLSGAQAIFVEIPTGSQSAVAMKGYGACMALLAALRQQGYAFVELTPTDIKLAGHGTKGATKAQMIDWAMATHPQAPWPMRTQKGVTSVIAAQAEHMADAVAAIHAGLKTPDFHRLLPLLRAA